MWSAARPPEPPRRKSRERRRSHGHAVVTNAGKAAMLTVTGDAVVDLAKASELFDVDVDQVSGMLPLVALHWRFGLQISQAPQSQGVEHPCHGGEGTGRQPGDVAQVQALNPELLGILQVLRIEVHRCEVGTFYWTVPAPDIVNSAWEEKGSVSV